MVLMGKMRLRMPPRALCMVMLDAMEGAAGCSHCRGWVLFIVHGSPCGDTESSIQSWFRSNGRWFTHQMHQEILRQIGALR
jgi:hypothetical protein